MVRGEGANKGRTGVCGMVFLRLAGTLPPRLSWALLVAVVIAAASRSRGSDDCRVRKLTTTTISLSMSTRVYPLPPSRWSWCRTER